MFGTVASNEILKVVGERDALGFCGTQEVVLDRIGIIPAGHNE
jgi:hypothetical protein